MPTKTLLACTLAALSLSGCTKTVTVPLDSPHLLTGEWVGEVEQHDPQTGEVSERRSLHLNTSLAEGAGDDTTLNVSGTAHYSGVNWNVSGTLRAFGGARFARGALETQFSPPMPPSLEGELTLQAAGQQELRVSVRNLFGAKPSDAAVYFVTVSDAHYHNRWEGSLRRP